MLGVEPQPTITYEPRTLHHKTNLASETEGCFSLCSTKHIQSLSTKWVDYVEKPMKYQALRPQFFSMGGWVVVGWGG